MRQLNTWSLKNITKTGCLEKQMETQFWAIKMWWEIKLCTPHQLINGRGSHKLFWKPKSLRYWKNCARKLKIVMKQSLCSHNRRRMVIFRTYTIQRQQACRREVPAVRGKETSKLWISSRKNSLKMFRSLGLKKQMTHQL